MSIKTAWPAKAYLLAIIGTVALAVLLLVALNPAGKASAQPDECGSSTRDTISRWWTIQQDCPDEDDDDDDDDEVTPTPVPSDDDDDDDDNNVDEDEDEDEDNGHHRDCDRFRDELDELDEDEDEFFDHHFVRDHDGCIRVIVIKKEVVSTPVVVASPQTIVIQAPPVTVNVPAPQVIIQAPPAPAAPPPPQQVAAAAAIVPPRSGDAGLADSSTGISGAAAAAIAFVLAGLGTAGFVYSRRTTRD
jgi:hypothetical protein